MSEMTALRPFCLWKSLIVFFCFLCLFDGYFSNFTMMFVRYFAAICRFVHMIAGVRLCWLFSVFVYLHFLVLFAGASQTVVEDTGIVPKSYR